MRDTIVTALGVEIFQDSADPFAAKQHFKHVVVVADKDVLELCESFFRTAAYLHVIIPKQQGTLVCNEAYRKAVEFGAFNRGLLYGVSIAIDLSGIDSDSIDAIVISTDNRQVMDYFTTHAARITKECARVVVVTKEELDEKYFGDRAIAGLRKVENFYCGTVRKIRTTMPAKKKPSKSRRKPIKPK